MGSAISEALILIIRAVGSLLVAAALLRLLLQVVRADFYNPVCQAIVKITAPLVNPLRRVIPGWRGFDFASLVLALLISTIACLLMMFLRFGGIVNPGTVISWAFVGIVNYVLNIYFFATLISVVASFIAPFSGHPILLIIHQLLQPLYRLAHRILPPMGGLDFSPMLIMLGIQVLQRLIIPVLRDGLQIPTAVIVIGL